MVRESAAHAEQVTPEMHLKPEQHRFRGRNRKNRKYPRKAFLNNPHPARPLFKNHLMDAFGPQGKVPNQHTCWFACPHQTLSLTHPRLAEVHRALMAASSSPLYCPTPPPTKMIYFRTCLTGTTEARVWLPSSSCPSTNTEALIKETQVTCVRL